MKIVSMAIMLLLFSSSQATRIPAFLKSAFSSSWATSTPEQKSGQPNLIPPLMSALSQFTKGMPVEYQPVPVIVGTKAELVELKKILDNAKSLPEHSMDFDTNVPDDHVMSVPFAMADIIRPMPDSDPIPIQEHVKNVTCEVSIQELLPLLRTHPLPTLVHDSPEIILGMIQSLVPKPETFIAQPDTELLPSSKKLISLAVRNPDWVRALIRAEPSILNDMLGLSSDSAPTTEEATDAAAA